MDNEANSSRSLCDGYVRSVDVFLLSISGDVWKECLGRKKSWMNEKRDYVVWIPHSDGGGDDLVWHYSFMKSCGCGSRVIWNVILYGEMAERSIASDCKSDASRLRRFKSYSPQV